LVRNHFVRLNHHFSGAVGLWQTISNDIAYSLERPCRKMSTQEDITGVDICGSFQLRFEDMPDKIYLYQKQRYYRQVGEARNYIRLLASLALLIIVQDCVIKRV